MGSARRLWYGDASVDKVAQTLNKEVGEAES